MSVLSGCGGDDPAVSGGQLADAPGSAGAFAVALPAPIDQLDPLLADERAERFVARQVSEPLVDRLKPPFGGRGGSPGLATSVRSTAAASVWRIRLRGRVRFQDGARFDAAAVLANAARWQALDPPDSPAAELLGADSPKPGLVRFILDGSDPSFDAALGSSKLGIVSPRAIRDDGSIAPLEPSGTGPFELREREFDRLLLARNIEWWGTRRDLGPGFDQIEIELDASDAGRADSLLAGEVMLADELPAAEARRLGRDPLLVGLTVGGGEITGLERSVRGIESIREAPSLAGAWLTRLEPG